MKFARLKIALAVTAALSIVASHPSSSATEPVSSNTRVQVICPSSPVTDEYTTVTLVARDEKGQIDPDFGGHAWLWTNGPWIRPNHVKFRPEDKGVIKLPVKFNIPSLQRVEAYEPGVSKIHTWSNPVVPILSARTEMTLLWGKLGDCSEPGLDFCISLDGASVQQWRGRPIVLRGVKRQQGQETLYGVVNPAVADTRRNELLAELGGSDDPVAVFRNNPEAIMILRTGIDKGGFFSRMPPALLLLDEKTLKDGKLNLPVEAFGEHILGVVSTDMIGAWCQGAEPERIWQALKQGSAYAAQGNRIYIGPPSQKSIIVAGTGPTEAVSVLTAGSDGLSVVREIETDDYKVSLDSDFLIKLQKRFSILALDRGSLHNSFALYLCTPPQK